MESIGKLWKITVPQPVAGNSTSGVCKWRKYTHKVASLSGKDDDKPSDFGGTFF